MVVPGRGVFRGDGVRIARGDHVQGLAIEGAGRGPRKRGLIVSRPAERTAASPPMRSAASKAEGTGTANSATPIGSTSATAAASTRRGTLRTMRVWRRKAAKRSCEPAIMNVLIAVHMASRQRFAARSKGRIST
jgi:hypothetical protein